MTTFFSICRHGLMVDPADPMNFLLQLEAPLRKINLSSLCQTFKELYDWKLHPKSKIYLIFIKEKEKALDLREYRKTNLLFFIGCVRVTISLIFCAQNLKDCLLLLQPFVSWQWSITCLLENYGTSKYFWHIMINRKEKSFEMTWV